MCRAVPRQHLAPHLAAALGRGGALRAVGHHPGPDRAVGRPGHPGQPQRAGPRGSLPREEHRGHPSGLHARPGRGGAVRRHAAGRRRSARGPRRDHVVGAPGRPEGRQPDVPAPAAGPALLLGGRRARRRPLRARRQGPRDRAGRARARPGRHRGGQPDLGQPAHRLHPRQRRDRGVRQPASGGRRAPVPQHPVGRGPGGRPGRPVEPLSRWLRVARLLRRDEPHLQHRRQPSRRQADRARPVERRGRRGRGPGPVDDVRRRGRRADRQRLHQAALRREVLRAEPHPLRPRARRLQDPLRPQARARWWRRSLPG